MSQTSPSTEGTAEAGLNWPDRALIVVHGIGEQRPGDTLDAIVRGLKSQGAEGGELVQEDRPFGQDLPPDAIRVRKDDVELDVYEVYWAPLTARKTTPGSVLWWLLRATFLPGASLRRTSLKSLQDLAAGLIAGALVALVALGALTSLGNLSAQVACRTDPEVVCDVPIEQRAVSGEAVTWRGLAQVTAIAGAIAKSLDITDRPLADLTPSHGADVLGKVSLFSWLLMLLVGFLGAQLLFRLMQLIVTLVQGRDRFSDNHLLGQLLLLTALSAGWLVAVQLLAPVLTGFVLVLMIAWTVGLGARRFLAESLGDVQVYSERDENSAHHAARGAVLKESERLFELIASRGYDHIVIVGHSLGSVIAFTSLDRLVRRLPPLLPRIEAFITIGTALEKVRFFFERPKEADEAASYRLVAPAQKIADGRAWLNLWYENDLVANPITTFQPKGARRRDYRWNAAPPLPELLRQSRDELVVNLSFGFPISAVPYLPLPVWTHSRYWADAGVMAIISEVAFGAASAEKLAAEVQGV